MLGEASLGELGLWAALSKVSPFGEYRADLRAALSCALFANAHRDREKKPEPYRVLDFLLFAEREPEAPLGAQLKGALAGMAGGRKGEDFKAWRSARRREVKAKR